MLLERVRRALAPDYEILEEIAGGGMGLVFAARQRRLDRRVALKILRPEHATAIAAERFLAEGRVLARLAHPNIVPVYDAGEADGLLYYVMEFVAGETLASRLARGALPREEALALARDLLGALGAAHALGVVHRDVKPANIFLRHGRALLGDFGIARWREKDAPEYTTPGELIGTPRYMAPEQRDGDPATPRTDVYAAGLVLWEACTGKRWPAYQMPERGDWGKLPRVLVPALRRALELEPERRWADASQFLAAIDRAQRRRVRPGALLGAGALAVVLAGYWMFKPLPACLNRAELALELPRFDAAGPESRAVADSAAAQIRELLAGHPDFSVCPAGERSAGPHTIRLQGAVRPARSGIQLTIQERGSEPQGDQLIAVSDSGSELRALAGVVAAKLVYRLLNRLENDQVFRGAAIPSDPILREQLAKAEQFFSLGQWEDAQQAYVGVGTGCLLCVFRLLDIARWFGWPADPANLALLQRNDSSFPPYYQKLIHAFGTPVPARFDTLKNTADSWQRFFLAPFEYADELFHRGPLYGGLRAEALAPFRKTLRLRPHFEPGLEHLTWLLVAEGDSAAAKQELDSLQAHQGASEFSGALVALRELGFYWRFLPVSEARQFSQVLLGRAELRRNPDAVAGARLLMSMDAPRGAFELGGLFTHWKERGDDAVLPGLLAQLYGAVALGWLDSLPRIRARFAGPEAPAYRLLALELEAVLRAFDPDSTVREAAPLGKELAAIPRQLASESFRARATWALGLVAASRGDTAALTAARATLRAQAADPVLGRILEAAALGRGEPGRALELLREVPPLDREVPYADPLEDAVAHLLGATLQERLDSLLQASRTLRWHEHSQIGGHLLGDPQPGEQAWALGTLARWRRRALLLRMGVNPDDAEWCSVNRAVARLWAQGDPIFRARADTAARVAASASCLALP